MITDGMYVVAEYTGTQNTYYYRGMNLIGYVANDEIGYYRFNAHGDVVGLQTLPGKLSQNMTTILSGSLKMMKTNG